MTYKINPDRCPASQRSYVTRAMQASDRRALSVFEKMGYLTREMEAEQPAPASQVDEMADLRAEYERVIGKKPFMGWNAAKLREKISDATGGD